MLKTTITVNLDFNTFTKMMEKGYSGSGDDNRFIFNTFGGKELKEPLSVSQNLMLAYENHRLAKQILVNHLKMEK
jgi:hypothetical protein